MVVMGEIADWMFDKAMEDEIKLTEYVSDITDRYRNGVLLWHQKNGNEILIQNMTKIHIQNCIKMLQRRSDDGATLWINIFKQELHLRDIK